MDRSKNEAILNVEVARTWKDKVADFKARNDRTLRLAAGLLTVGVGAYLGVRGGLGEINKTLKSIEADTNKIERDTFNLNDLLIREKGEQREMAKIERRHISELVDAGEDFTYYPGLGVMRKTPIDGKQ